MRERLVLVCFPSSTEHLVHRPMSALVHVSAFDETTKSYYLEDYMLISLGLRRPDQEG